MCAVLPLMGNSDAGYCNEGLPDDVRNRRSDNVMGALTECTILMGSTVRMNVRKLECGPDEQKERDEPDAKISDPWVLWTDSTYSSHRNSHYSSGLQVCQSIKKAPGLQALWLDQCARKVLRDCEGNNLRSPNCAGSPPSTRSLKKPRPT